MDALPQKLDKRADVKDAIRAALRHAQKHGDAATASELLSILQSMG
jgi:hypothetical protein